jgi:hypothetical protein
MGTRARAYPPALDPAGRLVQVNLNQRLIDGELLAVNDTGLLLLQQRQVILVKYSVISNSSFEDLPPSVAVRNREPPSAPVREQLRLASRFPQGVTPERLQVLLLAYGQDSLKVFGP